MNVFFVGRNLFFSVIWKFIWKFMKVFIFVMRNFLDGVWFIFLKIFDIFEILFVCFNFIVLIM